MNTKHELLLVVPYYNKDAKLRDAHQQSSGSYMQIMVNEQLSINSPFLYVNEGTKDKNWNIIEHQQYFAGIFDASKSELTIVSSQRYWISIWIPTCKTSWTLKSQITSPSLFYFLLLTPSLFSLLCKRPD